MRVARVSRRFHDPWGNKQYGRSGCVCRLQYMVGRTQLDDHGYLDGEDERHSSVNEERWKFDTMGAKENTQARFVLSTKRGVERIRR